jgi:hypothetical protein
LILFFVRRIYLKSKGKKKFLTKNAVRAAVFLCLILIIVLGFNHFLGFADAEHSETVMKEFYQQKENTVDVVYFGTSASQRAYVVPKAFHEDGIACYTMACGTQPFVLTENLMKEALKTQKPKLFIVELRGTCQDKDSVWDVAVRRMLDNMKLSRNKIEAIHTVTDYAEGGSNTIDTSGWSYVFPILKYHGRWNPSKQPKYWGNIDYYKGYTLDHGVCFKTTEVSSRDFDANLSPTAKETEESLIRLLDFCDTIDTKVLFVISPYEATDYGMERLNYSQAICEDRGYTVLNFLSLEKKAELGLDDRCCYYNREHLNYYGSLKYTDYMSDYIKAHYDIPDRRGDDDHASWESEYERLMENMDTTYAEKYAAMMARVDEVEAGGK